MRNFALVTALLMALFPLTGAAGEYDDNCATGLAIYDVLVETDCSVNWTDETTGKVYCFSSEGTRDQFLEDAQANIRKAEQRFAELNSN